MEHVFIDPEAAGRDGFGIVTLGDPSGRWAMEVCGELDMVTAAQLDDVIASGMAESPRELVFDLAGVSFIDSSGIRALLRVAQQCSAQGCRLVFRRGPAQVQRILEVAGVDARLEFAE